MTGKLAIIGFGEAGSTFAQAAGWRQRAAAFDISPACKPAMIERGVCSAASAEEALAHAELALSLVTANQALLAAEEYASMLPPGALWCDMNSVAPDTKRQAARAIEAEGGRYVDVAVLAPVNPAHMNVPLLLSGVASNDAKAQLQKYGFTNVTVVGSEIGRASSIKIIRSVMIKGIEALTDEMMAAATAAGVADHVLASLDQSERREAWTDRSAYNLERMATHGARRAAEMEESAKTLAALGVDPLMTSGTIQRQRNAAIRNNGKRNAA